MSKNSQSRTSAVHKMDRSQLYLLSRAITIAIVLMSEKLDFIMFVRGQVTLKLT